MPLFNRTTEPEAPDNVEKAVWFDLGHERQKLVLEWLERNEGCLGGLPELTGAYWFSAVRERTGVMVTPYVAGELRSPEDLRPGELSHETDSEEARDLVLALVLEDWDRTVAEAQRSEAKAEADRANASCTGCGRSKDYSFRPMCDSCQSGIQALKDELHLASLASDGRPVRAHLLERIKADGT